MTRTRWSTLLLGILALAACTSYVQEPWVPDAAYLQQERSHSAQLEKELDRRLHWQQDR